MHAHLVAMALAALAQLGGDRYPVTPPADGDTAADAADAASGAEPGSQIVIPVDTPQPTLVDDPAGATPDVAAPDPAAASPPAEADPADSAAPLSGGGEEETPAAPPESSVLAGGPKPADVMRELLQPPSGGQLPGRPVTLGAAVGAAATRQAQTEQVQAYWNLSAAVAQYYLALQEAVELAALQQGVLAPSPAWATAGEQFDARVAATREAAVAAQERLHRLMGAAPGSVLPLPADSPHCGRYNTRYDEIFAVRTDPAAQQLNELLPLLFRELTTEVRAAADAGEWLNFVSEHRDPATDGTGLLRAYELLSLRRRAFIEAARTYNGHIAAYAELAAPDEVAPERVVSMLIRVSTGSPAGGDSGVQPAGAVEEADDADPAGDQGAASDGGRRTFAERYPMEVRRPFSRFRNRERSIVVRRGPLQRLLDRD
jgi:hypothetical protein